MSRRWDIVIRLFDERNDRILTLGGASFRTRREQLNSLATIPRDRDDSPFLLDIYNSNGDIVDDRPISASTVEALTGKAMAALEQEALQRYHEESAAAAAALRGAA